MTSSISSMGSYTSQMNAHAMHQRRDDLFNKIDSDGSGGLDKAEFSDFAKKLSEQSGNSLNVEDIFSTYDADGDGALSQAEMDSFMKESAPPPPVDMQKAMSAYGMNMGTDQLSSLLELLNNQQSSDEATSSANGASSINDYISKLLDALSNKLSSEDTYPLLDTTA